MITLAPMRVKYKSGRRTPKRRKWNSSPGSLTNVSSVTRPQRRSQLLLLSIVLAIYLTSLLWTYCPLRGPGTHTIGLLVYHFRRTPLRNILPTSNDRPPPPPKDPFKPRRRNSPPSQTFDPEVEAKVPPEKTEITKDLSSLVPSTRKGGAEVAVRESRTDSLPLGGGG